ALVVSRNVLSATLADPDLASLPSLATASDREGALRRLLTVDVIPNSCLLRVVAQSTDPREPARVANAVARAYMRMVAEWSYGTLKAQVKSLEDHHRSLSMQVREKEEELLKLAASRNDRGVRSDVNGQVTQERLDHFLADYDAAVAARIKTESEFEAETARPANEPAAKSRRSARLDDLAVRLDAARKAEKALLDRVQAAESFSSSLDVRLQIAQEQLASLKKMADGVVVRLESLRFEARAPERVSLLHEAGPAGQLVQDRRGPLVVLVTAVILCLLAAFTTLGPRRTNATGQDD
ncbi:MAG: hypothetical protein U0835_16845, partial [Isosphaeraceae bacterium]